MNLYYHIDPAGNFGDDLNEFIWDELLPGWREWDDTVTLFGVGTILNEQRLQEYGGKRILVVGSGFGYGTAPKLPFPQGWDIRCVRGPRSAKAMGLQPSCAIVDPAVMLPDLARFKNIPKRDAIVFVPHAASVLRHHWQEAAAKSSIEYVSPRENCEGVIQAIASASFVVAESMHAAIIADAFRVPWVSVRISSVFSHDKWRDWGESLQLEYPILDLFPLIEFADRATPLKRFKTARRRIRVEIERHAVVNRLKTLSRKKDGNLSSYAILQERKEKYREILEEVVRDYR